MPENAPPPAPNSAAPATSSTPLGTPTPPAPAATWRAPDTAAAWARGKSPEEILSIAESVVRTMSAPAGAAPAAPANPGSGVDPAAFADDDYVTGATLRAAVAAATANSDSVDLAASANLAMARREFAQDFDRYGPEITAMLSGVPKRMWTLDNLTRCVKLIRSEHVEDIVRERAQILAAEMHPHIRSGGAPSLGGTPSSNREHSLESEGVPAEWKARAKARGVTDSVVYEFCRANGMSEEAFYKQFAKPLNPIVQDIPPVKEATA